MSLYTTAHCRLMIITGMVLWLASCTPGAPLQAAQAEPQPLAAASATATIQPPTATISPMVSPTPTLAPTVNTPIPRSQVCSPLEDIQLSELSSPDLLKTLFEAPRPGQDDGHHGADFAFWSRGEHSTMLGLTVYSVLDGKVAGVIINRPPYGNAVIIETPLDRLPPGWLELLPAPAPTVIPADNLYCPPGASDITTGSGQSLYLLYAHFNTPPSVTLGQKVSCGQTIGEVGTSGKSVNPHLHLETRVGPSDAIIPEMAHYDNAASDDEMRNYCTWRVSGLFQMFDPMVLLQRFDNNSLQQ